MSNVYAVIGGSGLYELDDEFRLDRSDFVDTPYGQTSAHILSGRWQGKPVIFFPRHGHSHQVAPHLINYRANIWALKQMGVTNIFAVNAVGGITPELPPQTLAVPDQIIDYTSNRAHTFLDGESLALDHIDFTFPYSETLRQQLILSAEAQGIKMIDHGTYGCTNGPRLETKAEITKMKHDGCTMVGMTGMPEAALARELGIEYACIALIVNWGAGIEDTQISMEQIKLVLAQGMSSVRRVLSATLIQADQ